MNNNRLAENHKQLLVAIILLAVTARVAAAFYLGNRSLVLPGVFDQVSYHTLANRVLQGHGFSFGTPWWPTALPDEPTAFWSYLYTLFLTLVYAVFGVKPLAARLIQALLVGVGHTVLIYLIGTKLFGRMVGLVSAAMTSLYAYFVYYTATLMTESFYITAILASCYLAMLLSENSNPAAQDHSRSRRDTFLGFGFGLALGVTVFFRQIYLLFIPFLFFWIWFSRRKMTLGSNLRPLIFASAVLAAMILPFTYYNYLRFDRFVLLNSNAGYAFYWANHPIYGSDFLPFLPREMSSYQDLIPQELRHLDEAAMDQALLKLGLQFVIDDPVRYLRLSLDRIPEYFRFWPTNSSRGISNLARIGSFGILWPFMLYGLVLSIRNSLSMLKTDATRRLGSWVEYAATPEFLLLMFAVVYTTIHLLSWSLVRYRLPVDAVMIIFAALGVIDLVRRLISWRKASMGKKQGSSLEASARS